MSGLRAAAQQALEALEQSETTVPYEGFGMAQREAERKHQAAIAALRAALAEPVQEPIPLNDGRLRQYPDGSLGVGTPAAPVAWMFTDREGTEFFEQREDWDGWWTPLYTAPPQRKPLTDEEITRCWERMGRGLDKYTSFARAIERAHGIGGRDE